MPPVNLWRKVEEGILWTFYFLVIYKRVEDSDSIGGRVKLSFLIIINLPKL